MLLQTQIDAFAPAFGLTGWRKTTPIIITPPTPRHRHMVSDPALPMLAQALDNEIMTDYLRHRLPLLARARNMRVINSQLLDHKAGKRALIRYELSTPRQNAKLVIFGKIYGQVEQLMRVDQVMDALWYDVYSDDKICGIPQPLGIIPELSMHLYQPADGEFLDAVLAGAEGARAMHRTARWLGTLHGHALSLTKRFDLANELKNLADWATLVGETYPEMAGMALELLTYLQQQAQTIELETATPIHKDFHYRHVLVDDMNDGGVNVIDFDEMRLGDPNFDLAHFCANLHLLAYRQGGTPHHLRPLEERFLHAYAHHVGQSWPDFASANQERFCFFYVYSCIKIARQLCLGFGPTPAPVGEDQRRQVRMILEQGRRLSLSKETWASTSSAHGNLDGYEQGRKQR
ncbi:MAG: phosphotransferase [Caldilineaceae bacterium]